MTDLVDFSSRRWSDSRKSCRDFSPRDALCEALRLIDAGEIDPDHVIVLFGRQDGEASIADWRQAGSFGAYAQRGLIETVKLRMLVDAELEL